MELKQRVKELESKLKEKEKEIERQKKRCIREQEEKRNIERIEAVFEESDRIWGYRNITKELQREGQRSVSTEFAV